MVSNNKIQCGLIASGMALPSRCYSTDQLLESLNGKLAPGLKKSVNNLGVYQRYSVIPEYGEYLAGRAPRAQEENARTMGVAAARKCLDSTDADPKAIGLFIAITNTQDRPLPCLAYEIEADLKRLSRDVNVLNLQNQGCSVLPKALEIAQNYIQQNPDKTVLIVTSESITSLFPPVAHYSKAFADCKSEEELRHSVEVISNMLFGDCAVALLMGKVDEGLIFHDALHLTNIHNRDTEVINMNEGGTAMPSYSGFPYYHMTSEVPKTGLEYATELLKTLCSKEGFALDQVSHFLVHTGSRKILNFVCSKLGAKEDSKKSMLSYTTIQQYGNVSACSIPIMLHRLLHEDFEDEKDKIIAIITFGVGFSGSTALFRNTGKKRVKK